MSRVIDGQHDAIRLAMSNFRRKMKVLGEERAKLMKQIVDDGVAEARRDTLSKADRIFLKVLRIEGW